MSVKTGDWTLESKKNQAQEVSVTEATTSEHRQQTGSHQGVNINSIQVWA